MRPEPKKKGPMIWTIIIGLIMIMSVIGFLYVPDDTTETYDGHVINQGSDGFYYVKVNGRQARFNYHPSFLASLDVDSQAIGLLKSSIILIFTFDPNEDKDLLQGIDLARFELTNDLNDYFGMTALQATTLNSTSYNLPVITCANATATQPVVELKSGNDTRIYAKGDCIVLEALAGQDFVKLKDRVMYGMFDIIR